MPKFCRGGFSGETKERLTHDETGNARMSQPCAVCGRHVVAENKAGEWLPEIHYRPEGRSALKGRGRKR
jgi:hypothetical protein